METKPFSATAFLGDTLEIVDLVIPESFEYTKDGKIESTSINNLLWIKLDNHGRKQLDPLKQKKSIF
jgi:hypothetical protein